MRPTLAEAVLAYTTCASILTMVFHGTLGVPSYLADLFLMAGVLCFFFCWRSFYRRAQSHPGALPPHSDILNRWMLPFVGVALVCGTVALLLEIFHK